MALTAARCHWEVIDFRLLGAKQQRCNLFCTYFAVNEQIEYVVNLNIKSYVCGTRSWNLPAKLNIF